MYHSLIYDTPNIRQTLVLCLLDRAFLLGGEPLERFCSAVYYTIEVEEPLIAECHSVSSVTTSMCGV